MIQIILISIAAIVGLVILLGLIMEKEYSISSHINILKPKELVFNYVIHIQNQDKYSKWVMADPNVQISTSGTDGTVGFKSAWKSENKNVGEGEQEIIAIHDGEGYHAELRFEKPFKGVSYAHIKTEAISPNETKFTTTFKTKTPFPMNIMVPMIKKMLQKDMDENSANLKRVLEGA